MPENFFDESDFKRDTKYWNSYYEKTGNLTKPSRFARFVRMNYLCEGASLLELGCGNGRDSLYFAEQGLKVTAVDASDYAINELAQRNIPNAEFICEDFVQSSLIYSRQYDFCYSRFSLHAINAAQEDLLLFNVKNSLKSGGKFFIEVRSVNDPLFGKGTPVTDVCGGGCLRTVLSTTSIFDALLTKRNWKKLCSLKATKSSILKNRRALLPLVQRTRRLSA